MEHPKNGYLLTRMSLVKVNRSYGTSKNCNMKVLWLIKRRRMCYREKVNLFIRYNMAYFALVENCLYYFVANTIFA